jgi:hypothetical protein
MAAIQYPEDHSSDHGYDYGYEHAAPPVVADDASRVTLLVNWAGAIVSMGLVIGMAIWAWQLLMRDVTEVPVIRALEGPMRMAPVDPGGSVAENQGLAVNRLAEGEEAAPVPDRLVLAPPPIDLADAAPAEEAFTNASAPEIAAEPEEDPYVEPPIVYGVDVDVEPAPVSDTEALIARLLQEAQPLEPSDDAQLPNMADAPTDGTPDVIARAQTIPISIPGVRRSPRPTVRPAGLSARAAAAPVPVVAEAADSEAVAGLVEDETGFEIASAELEDGTRLVQLGAFDTADLARAEWQRLAGVFPDFFTGRARVIEEASSGGQTFYRLRAHGFGDLSASRRFCAALVAQGAACIPVTVR